MLSEIQQLLSLDNIPFFKEVVDSIEKQEGFNPNPYEINGLPHIGYGTLLPLTEIEAKILLLIRFGLAVMELEKNGVYQAIKNIQIIQMLSHMAYQLGVPKLMKFTDMLRALHEGNYELAERELMDSLLAKQTPNRAEFYAKIIRSQIQNKGN